MENNKEKGITLIALVVTIIVLLILAGISIGMLTGENGILTNAKNSIEANKQAEIIEKVKLMLDEYRINKEVSNESIMDYLEEQERLEKIRNLENLEDGTYKLTVGNYEITIEESNLEIIDILEIGKSIRIDNIKITYIDDNDKVEKEARENAVEIGTPLKIAFDLSVESETEIVQINKGTVKDKKVEYVTDGKEKEVIFIIIGKTGGKEVRKREKIVLDKLYEKLNMDAYTELLKTLYINASELQLTNKLPKTYEDLVNSQDIFNKVIKSNDNVKQIIENSNIFIDLIINNENAMKVISENDYAGYAFIMNKTCREAIMSSKYLDIFNVEAKKVPIMTSNISPRGEAFSSKYETGGEPYRCFDDNDSTYGIIARPYTLNGYIGYKFAENVIPYYVMIKNYERYSNYLSNIKIQASKDDVNWVDLTGVLTIPTSGWSYIKLLDDKAYDQYQSIRILQTTDKGSAYYAGAWTIQFFCR